MLSLFDVKQTEEEYLPCVRYRRLMGALSGLSQVRNQLQCKTQAAELRSLEELYATGVTQVLRPVGSFPATSHQ